MHGENQWASPGDADGETTGWLTAHAMATAMEDTFPKLLRFHAETRGNRPAFRHKDRGIWQTWTWSEVYANVRAIAQALKKLGVGPGDKVAIVGANRPDALLDADRGADAARRAGAGLCRRRRRRNGLSCSKTPT